jgi:hypothetical protein
MIDGKEGGQQGMKVSIEQVNLCYWQTKSEKYKSISQPAY